VRAAVGHRAQASEMLGWYEQWGLQLKTQGPCVGYGGAGGSGCFLQSCRPSPGLTKKDLHEHQPVEKWALCGQSQLPSEWESYFPCTNHLHADEKYRCAPWYPTPPGRVYGTLPTLGSSVLSTEGGACASRHGSAILQDKWAEISTAVSTNHSVRTKLMAEATK
jgi:hypothetical protein